jgi:hypothetical protein
MRVFTNTYFPLHKYKYIYNTLKQPQSILKFEEKIYVPLIIYEINNYNKNISVKNKFNIFILDSVDNYKSKFIYINDDFYDLINDSDIRLYKIHNNFIKISKDIRKYDVLLIEDKHKFTGVI